ncbi:MAG: DUF4838 domain-containing protein [Candidatus Eisenbacteria bacterium]|uniref:DUF4838 domain-containing protein n=1 Tax=Eiseniibacteriota bacterium TaxID=2212470 RepID=A0A948W592_UNCEI|nr:DUF4838 domain-containing protein [Candidatus Eisenbacteria bacterium]MBU1951039.1 DUF4838 domain-containing protein [Candidatus Eisenbacteria bacterium]MBU2689770.1 DUF4838 domain-containing protein [Candidatus Eisenbacteria bacterium]
MWRSWRRLTLLVTFLCGVTQVGAAPGNFILVQDGKSEVGVCAGTDVPAPVYASIDILRRYIREISGVDLPLIHSLSEKSPQIIVEIGASRDPKLSVADLGNDGFRLKTTGKDLVFTAKTADGFQNAVYTFLESYLGCRKYSFTVEVVPQKTTIILPGMDDQQIPQLSFRMQDIRDAAYVAWHKLDTNDDFGLFVHTFKELVPPDKYFKEHPEYFSMLNGSRTPEGQLCLTNPDVFNIVVEELRARMSEKPGSSFWSVSQNDTYAPCECEFCRAAGQAEGAQSGSILAFVNRVAEKFPDQTISTLAYQYSRSAPRRIKPRPNVNIMLCSIECNRSKPLADDPGSVSFVKDVRDWGKLTHNIFLWDYVIQFRNLVSPFPNLRVLQPNIQFFVESGITSIFEQGLPVMHGEFAELRIYLISKLLWNPYADVDAIINDFLQGYYGRAAPFIRQYIDIMHDALAASGEDLSIYGYPLTSSDGYLSPRMMQSYSDLFAKAEAAVNDDLEILSRVRTAHLPVQFAILEQAKVAGDAERGCFVRTSAGVLQTKPEIESLLALFVQRCREADIPRLWEHGTSPDEYFASTRKFLEGSTRPHLALSSPVVLTRPASQKYHQGDPAALTDGCKGWDDYHTHWLGFEGEDMEATLDLGAVKSISAINTDFLQDINSWIFMPLLVTFSISKDGMGYREVGKTENTTAPEEWGAIIAPYNVTFESSRARYIRVKAVSVKSCPAWHKGSGGPAWIFIDEISVQ